MRVPQGQQGQPVRIDPHARHGQHDVGATAFRGHFHFGDGRALELGDAQLDLALDELAELVSFHMRTQALRAARDLDHLSQVVLDTVAIKQQGW